MKEKIKSTLEFILVSIVLIGGMYLSCLAGYLFD